MAADATAGDTLARMPDDPVRLPRTVVPSRYDLVIEPDLGTATFAGTVAIAVDITAPVAELVLNAVDLEIDEAWLERDGARLDAAVTLDAALERARLALDSEAAAGAWTLHARFRGAVNEKLTGFYRSTYTDVDGTRHAIAATQFEATHARRAFPCWDEPDFKAVFGVTLVIDETLAGFSNSRELSSEPTGDGRRRICFADTMPMSTYLVAFVVGPLAATDPRMVGDTPLRVAHRPSMAHLTKFALDTAEFALEWFADYYGIDYPGDKMDLIALPDFAFGAMENVGCVTFREVLLLVDPDRVGQPELQNVADVINHELAHMWFGDLVTMKWWNGLWLNEAFATFMEMKCTDAQRPDWERWVNFGLSRSAAFDVDSLATTRPIEFGVVSPNEAEGMFDVLTYEKGAAVLRMLEQFLGEEAFRDGIRHYLRTHSYANTETTDLWDAIEAVSGAPVRQIADTWIFQGGYPVVHVDLVGDGSTLRLQQEQFRFDDGSEPESPATKWAVPLILSYGSNGTERVEKVIFDERESEITLAFAPDWVLLNTGGSGFYRVRYSPKLLNALSSRGPNQLTSLERYGLVDDTMAAVLAGATTTGEFLDFARGFADEPDVAVWQRLAASLGAIERILDVDDPARDRFKQTVRALAGPALRRMGWEPRPDEGGRTRELRAVLFELVGVLGDDEDVRSRARQIFDAALASRDESDPALFAAAVTVIAETGDLTDFERFREQHANAATPQDEQRFLYSLAKFHDDDAIQQLLELSLTEMRTQNAPYVLRLALLNRTHGEATWDFLARHWDEINQRFPTNSISRMLDGIRALTTDAVANEVQAFLAEHPVPQGAKTVAQHLERLRVNVALREREADRLAAALA
jgi:puromycin-sensitive aminopeptidase